MPGVAVTLMQGVFDLPSPCCPDEPASSMTFIRVDCHTSIPYLIQDKGDNMSSLNPDMQRIHCALRHW